MGDQVDTTDPRTGKRATGTVNWISPTTLTIQVRLSDGTYAYEFPEHDYEWVQSEKSKNWMPVGHGLKTTVANAMSDAEMGELIA